MVVICATIAGYAFGLASAKYRWFPYQLLAEMGGRDREDKRMSYSYRKTDIFEKCGSAADVVMIGDSITDSGEWHELFPSIAIVNRGISGNKVGDLLERMESIYSTRAAKAFILIGINDFSSGAEVDEVLVGYKQVVDELRTRQISPYIQSTIKVRAQPAILNDKISNLNERLEKLANEVGITYIDLNRVPCTPGATPGRVYNRWNPSQWERLPGLERGS